MSHPDYHNHAGHADHTPALDDNFRPAKSNPFASPLCAHLEWDAVENRLPDDDITVLIATDDGEVHTGFHDAGQWRDAATAMRVGAQVTHWADLPAHPTLAAKP
jgi:hypothetical protein